MTEVAQELRALSDALYQTRPQWVTGTISHFDARYLFERALDAGAQVAVEVGTASGLSTAILGRALHTASRRGEADDFRLSTYDVTPQFFADHSKRTGDAAREMLDADLLGQITFRNPATAADVTEDHAPGSVGFIFLDADHRHPWPTLDLLAALDVLGEDAEIVLHDVNLPLLGVDSPSWGVKHIFDGLDVRKELDRGGDVPNIGSCWVPSDKTTLRDQLLEILYAHRWEADVDVAYLTRVLSPPSRGDAGAAPAQLPTLTTEKPRGPAAPRVQDEHSVPKFHSFLRRAVPPSAQTLVVSKGDAALVNPHDRRAGHFPQRSDGVYAGYYPPDGSAAISHLEVLREGGAEFLAFPTTGAWWLDHYPDFGGHLESNYRLMARSDVAGVLYALFEPGSRSSGAVQARERSSGAVQARERSSGAVQARERSVEPTRSPPSRTDAGPAREDLSETYLRTLFNAEHYAAQSDRRFNSADEALDHYRSEGAGRGLSPHPLFDVGWYVRHQPDAAGVDPFLHFLRHGVERQLDPNPFFDTAYYYEQAPGLLTAGTPALAHYVAHASDNESCHPNPLFRDGYYLRTYSDARATQTPLEHYLHGGWREGRFVSHVHRDMAEHLASSSRGGLVRGSWKRGAVLFFGYGEQRSGDGDIASLAEEMAVDFHVESIIIAARRSIVSDAVPVAARLLVLEDYQLACDVQRLSSQRLLTKALTALRPLFAVSEVPEIIEILVDDGVGTYFLLPDVPELPPPGSLSEAFARADRVIVPSSEAFLAAAHELSHFPANVALRRPEAQDYTKSLLRLCERDFGLEPGPEAGSRPSAQPSRRVVIPCSDWAVSGVNASLEALGQELLAQGWEVEILFTRDQAWVTQSAQEGAHMPALPYRFLSRRRPGIDGMWEAMIADLERRAPAVVFTSYDFLANGALSALSDRVGVAMWVQADDGDYYEQVYRLGRYCDAIVCVSESISGKVLDLNPGLADRVHVVPNSSISERDIVSKRHGRTKVLRIVYAGRLVQYQKRILDFIDLAHSLDAAGVPYEITLIGVFPYGGEVKDAFERKGGTEYVASGRIRLTGRLSRDEILREFDASDFFVLLSEFEGLPLALVEAMARGCVPVTAAMESGIPEIVNSGENGVIVRGRDYNVWARTIVELFEDRRRLARMSQKARMTVRRKFTVQQVARQFERLFESILDDARASRPRRPPALHWGLERSWTGDVLPPPSIVRPSAVSFGGLRSITP